MTSFLPPPDLSSSPTFSPKQRRRSAALSCAECRRLKLRCSRVFPCTSCVKKGCAAICPDGSLTTGKGNRFILANTEALHDKIGALSNRVRQLEDALAEVNSYHSTERHPLLTDDLLQIKRPLERESRNEMPALPEAEAVESIDAVGSLSISDNGRTSFFGQTANSWYLLKNEKGSSDEEDQDVLSSPDVPQPTNVPWLSHAYPFATVDPRSVAEVKSHLYSFLPDSATAQSLADVYYRHAAWMYTPIEQTDFYDSILTRFYDPQAGSEEHTECHRLSVLYMVFALGALMDLERPPHSYDAHHYYHLGRAALAVESVFEEQSIPAIQALVLMSHFMFLSDIDGPRWALMGIVVKLAHSCGLHRDSGKFGLSPEETHRRRSLMWEIYTYDSWQSLTYGRPPSFSLFHMDCQLPTEAYKDENGDEEFTFTLWKHRFASQCQSIVHDQAFGARTPNYRVIQQLDRKTRDFYTPPSLQVPGFGGPMSEIEPAPLQLTLQRYIGFAIKEMTLFYMHRGFFARAIEDSPEDPLGSKYAPSVLAAYNSAGAFVGLIKSLFSQQPALTERMWFLFTHVFSCAIVLGSIPIKCPSMALARSALTHLDSALRLFEQVSKNPRSAKVLPVLRKQRERAIASMTEAQHHQSPRVSPDSERDVKKEDEELATLGGKTRLVPRKASSNPSSPAAAPSLASSSPRNSPGLAHASAANSAPPPHFPPASAPAHAPTHPLAHAGPAHAHAPPHHSQWQQDFAQSPVSPQLQSPQMPPSYHYTPYPAPAQWSQQVPADYQFEMNQAMNHAMADGTQDYTHGHYAPPSFDYEASAVRGAEYLTGATSHHHQHPPHPPHPHMNGMQTEISHIGDPTAAWHSLVTQFNHV
ncbi:hypothetical protein FA95DRAFT_1559311 [Auriscalpium vulgare]|uniref:Uncharacterized protein n=1 Tax=Auriscalpium vulgare TaxID=40419 RepID=A0ACB8RSW6_9AGAM|nr:hypothetical protein FA95DRAFT_1559311 [Auriscalpium vulgare]